MNDFEVLKIVSVKKVEQRKLRAIACSGNEKFFRSEVIFDLANLQKSLLKAMQESVVEVDSSYNQPDENYFECSKCKGFEIERHFNYCPDCGSKIEWR